MTSFSGVAETATAEALLSKFNDNEIALLKRYLKKEAI